jgi:exopolysaccharide production protein ExoY
MEHLVLILAAAAALIGAAFSKILADEFKAWRPSIVSSILAVAVKALPPSRRDRSAEEWTSHLDESPGDLSKVILACGFVYAAWKIATEPFGLRKRAFDVAIALSALVLLAPVMFLIAFSIKLDGPGSVFFRSKRVGRHGKPITLVKFRTMDVNSEFPMVTQLGMVLRASSFDELPQLLNVLNGDMSLVGPRPLTGEELGSYPAAADTYLTCRPGLTGLWQLSRRSGANYIKSAACDLFYSRNWSMGLDSRILVATLLAVLRKQNVPPDDA